MLDAQLEEAKQTAGGQTGQSVEDLSARLRTDSDNSTAAPRTRSASGVLPSPQMHEAVSAIIGKVYKCVCVCVCMCVCVYTY
jgi:hypothetical protein